MSDLFIVDNGGKDWKAKNYLYDRADLAHAFGVATGYFEIGALLALDGEWQKLDALRIVMGDEVSKRARAALLEGVKSTLDESIEHREGLQQRGAAVLARDVLPARLLQGAALSRTTSNTTPGPSKPSTRRPGSCAR